MERPAPDTAPLETAWLRLDDRDYAIAAVYRGLGRAVDAEDCVHDAVLLLIHRSDLDPRRVRPLLTRAAMRIAFGRLRSQRRAEKAAMRLGVGNSRGNVSPDEIVADREAVGRVIAVVCTLPRRERQVMMMRLAGHSVEEAARLLGLSAKSVEGTYTRARARVRLIVGPLAWLATAVLFFAGGLAEPGSARGEGFGDAIGSTCGNRLPVRPPAVAGRVRAGDHRRSHELTYCWPSRRLPTRSATAGHSQEGVSKGAGCDRSFGRFA